MLYEVVGGRLHGVLLVWWLGLLDSHTTMAVLSNATEGPGECSFLPSPNDLQGPPGSLCGTSCLAGSVSTAALCILPLLFRWWAVFSWHGNIGREKMPRLLVLARRRGTADKQAWSSVLTAALDSFHLASAVQAQRRDISKGLFFKLWDRK